MPDFFHLVHEIVKSYSLAIGRRLRHAHQAFSKPRRPLARARRPSQRCGSPAGAGRGGGEAAEVQHWESVHRTYRHHLETLSLTCIPSVLPTRPPDLRTGRKPVARGDGGHRSVRRSASVAGPTDAMDKVRKQLAGLAALVDFWWQGVRQDLEHSGPLADVAAMGGRVLAAAGLLGAASGPHALPATQSQDASRPWKAVQAAFEPHPITQQLAPEVLAEWQAWATERVKAFQRASSAVEGRNGYLSQMHHNHRGLPKRRYKVWTVLHNFDCRAADGTTPASRFFRRAFPDLFETVLSQLMTCPGLATAGLSQGAQLEVYTLHSPLDAIPKR